MTTAERPTGRQSADDPRITLEEEIGERSVGFRIEDEDLEDIKTVRDAVDYVLARL